jgi:glutaredoxin
MNRIKIYTNETCPYCKSIKEELDKKDIKFINMDTTEHKNEWQEVVNLTGMGSVPTVKYNGEFYVPARDFGNPEHLINILNNKENSKYDYSRQTFEKVKTLNYNMGQAFQRMDQLLKQIETKLNIEENDG